MWVFEYSARNGILTRQAVGQAGPRARIPSTRSGLCVLSYWAMSESRPVSPALPRLDTRHFTLPNGLELLVHEDRSAPVASVQAWVQTGSIHEGRHLGSGISHLLEHMLFKGTPTRNCSQIAQQVQDVGGYINAYTSFDRTVYWVDLPSKGVPAVLEILADAVFHSTLPAEEFVKEQEVIRREFAMGFDDPDRLSSERLFATAYQTHHYRYPVIGHLDVFNALTRDDLFAYYKRRYVPNNVFFVVAGDVDADAVHEELLRWVGPLPRMALEPVWIPAEPRQLVTREVSEAFPTELTRLCLAWHTPDIRHKDTPALDLLASILGDGRSARLYRSLREELGIVHSVGAWCYAPVEAGLFGLSAVLDPERADAVRAALLAQVESVCENGILPQELEKVRRMRLSSYISGLATARGRASDIGDSWLTCRNADFSRIYTQMLAQVQPEDLQRVARHYLLPDRVNVVAVHPADAPAVNVARGQTPVRGGIRRHGLSNGLRTLVCEDKRLPMVSIVIGFKGGRLEETPQNNGISKLFTRVLLKGTASRSARQIAEEIESLGGGISADAGKGTITIGVSVLRDDLERGLELLSDVVSNAVFPEDVLNREKEVQLAGIKAEKEDPFAVAGQALRRHLLEGHPDGFPPLGTPESVGSLDRAALLAFRERYLVGRNGVLSIFGDVEESRAAELAARYFGGMPAGNEALCEPVRPAPLSASQSVSEVIERQQAILMVGYRGVDLFDADETALSLLDEACSDLGSRMFVRIREQLGLAYSVGSSQFSGLACGTFVFYVGTDPIKQTAVLAELQAEILGIAKEGLTVAELSRAKEKSLGSMELRNQNPGAFAAGCTVDELFGLGAENYLAEREKIRSVTLEEVRAVAARHFAGKPCVTAIAGPVAAALVG